MTRARGGASSSTTHPGTQGSVSKASPKAGRRKMRRSVNDAFAGSIAAISTATVPDILTVAMLGDGPCAAAEPCG